jgi:hypothetical protein
MLPPVDSRVRAPKEKKARTVDLEVERLRQHLSRLAKQPHPVIAGPFTGEVGFELLYWLPLLRWAVKEFPDLRGRLVVVSRGGTWDWTSGMDATYVDILDLFPTSDFAAHRSLADKQREVAEFDERVLAAVRRRPKLGNAAVLHPSVLYQSYFRMLKANQLAYARACVPREGHEGVIDGLGAVYERIPVPEAQPEVLAALPKEYTAVRFYTSLSFPNGPDTERFVSSMIATLAEQGDVVLLGAQFGLDEHQDAAGKPPTGVTTIDHLMRPQDNLAIQTQVVGRAKAFVGTYGGYSYLAPFLGVPSLSFSMNRSKTHSWHHTLADRIFANPGWAPFLSLRHTDLALIDMVTLRERTRAAG